MPPPISDHQKAIDARVKACTEEIAKNCPPHENPTKEEFEEARAGALASLRNDLQNEFGVDYTETNNLATIQKASAARLFRHRRSTVQAFEVEVEEAIDRCFEGEGIPEPMIEDEIEAVIEAAKKKSGLCNAPFYTGDLDEWLDRRKAEIEEEIDTRIADLLAAKARQSEVETSSRLLADQRERERNALEARLKRDPSLVLAMKVEEASAEDAMSTFPSVLGDSEIIGTTYETMEEARAVAIDWGAMVLPKDLHARDLVAGLIHAGFGCFFDELVQSYFIYHRGQSYNDGTDNALGRFDELAAKEVVKSAGSSLYPLTRARNLITGSCVHILPRTKIEKEMANPSHAFKIAQMSAKSWGSSTELFQVFASLRGMEMPVKNDIKDLAGRMLADIGTLTAGERAILERKVQRVFLDLPGLKPAEGQENVAAHVGRYLYGMLGHRIIQHHPTFKDREPRAIREVPVIWGKPGIGKSTICEHLVPRDQGMQVGKMMPHRDPNELGRAVLGKTLVIVNELTGLDYNSQTVETTKGFITEPVISVHKKYEDTVEVKMPCVFIATANEVKLSANDGLLTRFVAMELQINDDDPRVIGKSGEERAMIMIEYIKANRLDWIKAGIFLAIQNAPLEGTADLTDARLKGLQKAAGSDQYLDALRSMVEEIETNPGCMWRDADGRPFITAPMVAWKAAALVYSKGIDHGPDRGDLIEPDDEGVKYTHIAQAYAYTNRNATQVMAKRVEAAFKKIGWHDKDGDGNLHRAQPNWHRQSVNGWRPRDGDYKI